jgi:hypothetical protein
MKVVAREYKVMLDQRAFADPAGAVPRFWQEVREFARGCGAEPEGKFDLDRPKEREIVFLDTPSYTLQANGLVLRRRAREGTYGSDHWAVWTTFPRP